MADEQPRSADLTAIDQSANQPIAVEEARHEEIFSDDRRIGRRGKNKVHVRCYETGGKSYADITFDSRNNSHMWSRSQYFRLEKDPVAVCDPQIKDFNNDGFKDLTYASRTAARGANELRTLLIYDNKNDELKVIRNSADFPNLEYNEELNCLTAWAFHGATTTMFVRLEGDVLREFASVDTGSERVVTVTRRDGTKVVIRREKMDPDNFEEIYTRFSTYDPPK